MPISTHEAVATGLDITAFGVQIMDLPPDYTTSSHDESDTGQQELYVALRGSGAVVAGAQRMALDAELCLGGVPGAAHTPPEWTAAD